MYIMLLTMFVHGYSTLISDIYDAQ